MCRYALILSLLVGSTSIAWANISCADLVAGSPAYEARMTELAKLADFPGKDFTRHHEKFIASYCQGDSKSANLLVSQGRVPAKDAAAIRRLVRQGVPALDLVAANSLVNDAFVDWSRSWFMDRYVAQSARATEQRSEGGQYYLRGTFRFTRGGGLAEIPFSATLRQAAGGLSLNTVCYNDTTTGMTDCSDSGIGAQSRQLMGAIVVLGLLGAFSNGGSASDVDSSSTNAAPLYRQRTCTKETTCEPGYSDVYGWHAGECRTETRCD